MLTLEEHFEKTRNLAMALFPNVKWIQIEPQIWVAENRLNERDNEPKKWERVISSAHTNSPRECCVFSPGKRDGTE